MSQLTTINDSILLQSTINKIQNDSDLNNNNNSNNKSLTTSTIGSRFKSILTLWNLPINSSLYSIIFKRPLTVITALILSLIGIVLSSFFSFFTSSIKSIQYDLNQVEPRIRRKPFINTISRKNKVENSEKFNSNNNTGVKLISSPATTTNTTTTSPKASLRKTKSNLIPLLESTIEEEEEEETELLLPNLDEINYMSHFNHSQDEEDEDEDDFSEVSTLEEGEILGLINSGEKKSKVLNSFINLKKENFHHLVVGKEKVKEKEKEKRKWSWNSSSSSSTSNNTSTPNNVNSKPSTSTPSTSSFIQISKKLCPNSSNTVFNPKSKSTSTSTTTSKSKPKSKETSPPPQLNSIPTNSTNSKRNFTVSNKKATLGNPLLYPSLDSTLENFELQEKIKLEAHSCISGNGGKSKIDASGNSGLNLELF